MTGRLASEQCLTYDEERDFSAVLEKISQTACQRFQHQTIGDENPREYKTVMRNDRVISEAFDEIGSITKARCEGTVKALKSARIDVAGARKDLQEWSQRVPTDMRDFVEEVIRDFDAAVWIAEQGRLHSYHDALIAIQRTR